MQRTLFEHMGVKGGSSAFPEVANCQLIMGLYSKLRSSGVHNGICLMLRNVNFTDYQRLIQ